MSRDAAEMWHIYLFRGMTTMNNFPEKGAVQRYE